MDSKIGFSTICLGFVVRIELEHLSGRDKVELFRTLMDQLGISERMSAEPDETGRAQQIITEQWDKYWHAKA